MCVFFCDPLEWLIANDVEVIMKSNAASELRPNNLGLCSPKNVILKYGLIY